MSHPSADEIYELLKQAVPAPNLTIEAIKHLIRRGDAMVQQSTADINDDLRKNGVQGKGNRGIRGELCICLVHLNMRNRPDFPLMLLGVNELCKRYDLQRVDVERDPYFPRYCYYLRAALSIVEPAKHKDFIIQDVLVPLSGAYVDGIKYITGGGKEASRTMIRYKAFELESRLLRPKTLLSMIASGSSLLCGFNDSFKVTYKEKGPPACTCTCTYSEYLLKHAPETSEFCPAEVLQRFVQKFRSEGDIWSTPLQESDIILLQEVLLSEVSHSEEGDTSSTPLQESTVTLQPEGSLLLKRSHDETVTSPSVSSKRVYSPSIYEDHCGHTTLASDSSSICDLPDLDLSMEVLVELQEEVSHALSPCGSTVLYNCPQYTPSAEQESVPISHETPHESDLQDFVEYWAVENNE